MSGTRSYVAIAAVAVGLKLLLFPTYRSTDFEVHRNWLAITHSLPVNQWYTEDTSPWTLDYPPFFAWLEYALSHVARLFDPDMLVVGNLDYASPATVLFQRLSVVVTDVVYMAAALALARHVSRERGRLHGVVLFTLLVLNAGLLLVDHIHFQYNGVVIGVLLWSLYFLLTDRYWLGGVAYTCLVHLKHLYVYCAPVMLVYIARAWCGGGVRGAGRFLFMGATVAAVSAASLGPFVMAGQLPQLLSRLFPFGRGLTHSYWAANAWALYCAADKALAHGAPHWRHAALGGGGDSTWVDTASGQVGVGRMHVLPQVGPRESLLLVGLSLLPPVLALMRRPEARRVPAALAYVLLSGFWFGYHVHEKAILPALLPLTVSAVLHPGAAQDWLVLAAAGHVGLLPLLHQAEEYPVKLLLCLVYWLVAAHCLAAVHKTGSAKQDSPEGEGMQQLHSVSSTGAAAAIAGGLHAYPSGGLAGQASFMEQPGYGSQQTQPSYYSGSGAGENTGQGDAHGRGMWAGSVGAQDAPAAPAFNPVAPQQQQQQQQAWYTPQQQPFQQQQQPFQQWYQSPPTAMLQSNSGGLPPAHPCPPAPLEPMNSSGGTFSSAPGTFARNSAGVTSGLPAAAGAYATPPSQSGGGGGGPPAAPPMVGPPLPPPTAAGGPPAGMYVHSAARTAKRSSGTGTGGGDGSGPLFPPTTTMWGAAGTAGNTGSGAGQEPGPTRWGGGSTAAPLYGEAQPSEPAWSGGAAFPGSQAATAPAWQQVAMGAPGDAARGGAVQSGASAKGLVQRSSAALPPLPPNAPFPPAPPPPPPTQEYASAYIPTQPAFYNPDAAGDGSHYDTMQSSQRQDVNKAGQAYYDRNGSGGGSSHGGAKGDGWSLSGMVGAGRLLHPLLALYVAGFLPLEVYCSAVHPLVLGQRLPFLPLLLTSMYCSLGVGYVWLRMLLGYCGIGARYV